MIDIICITGQTCAGKNTMYNVIVSLLKSMGRNPIIPEHFSDRPPRIGDDNDPVTIYVSKSSYDLKKNSGIFWEDTAYTVCLPDKRTGVWRYATLKPDSNIEGSATYITIADVGQVKKYVELAKGTEFNIMAIICSCNEFDRLSRYALREKENNGNIREVLRRFESDLDNRNEEELTTLGIPYYTIHTDGYPADIGLELSKLAIGLERGWVS